MPFVTFYETCYQLAAALFVKVGSKNAASSEQRFVYLWRGICRDAGAARTSLLAASCCLCRVNGVSSFPRQRQTEHNEAADLCRSLLSVWCVGALQVCDQKCKLNHNQYNQINLYKKTIVLSAASFIQCLDSLALNAFFKNL